MKYVDTIIGFSEVPEEISLCINISNCIYMCEGCHSPELRQDRGKPLNWNSLNALIHINKGITCVCLMGGDGEPKEINKLAHKVKNVGLKVCWYSGNDKISEHIDINNFDFIKIGKYKKDLGGLNSKTTNQIMYKVLHQSNNFELVDITNKFWKDENKDLC